MVNNQKALCYITHGNKLLVMIHPNEPEAGIQVPGGSIEPGEEPLVGALREASEETGLEGLEVVSLLGESMHMERYHRYFYHLRCTNEPPATWRHYELTPSDGSPAPIALDY
ncbi:MAG: NUDIX domain-containing protein, partial [Anaerolineae bacterium]|nr:NUDIX domain-containing protein [Anaerolineae bacterium]